MRLIDADKAYKVLTEYYHHKTNVQHDALKEALDKVPTIDAELMEPIEFEWCHDCKEYDQNAHCCHRWTKVIRNTINDLKTHGYEPVRHGHWEEFHCSVCGEMGWDNEDNYCPNCGAKMDEVEEDE